MRTLGSMPLNKQIKITGEIHLSLCTAGIPARTLCDQERAGGPLHEVPLPAAVCRDHPEAPGERGLPQGVHRQVQRSDHRRTQPRQHQLRDLGPREERLLDLVEDAAQADLPSSEIYDPVAIRIVFKPLPFPSEKTQCWQIYSTITDIYTPKPDRLRDWISMPKANGYEALHSTVMGPDGVWVEVQIRTQRMEDIAERGFAAHWKYKHATISQDEDEFDKWLKQIRAALNSPTENAVDFLDNFKLSLYTSEIVVFTPKGEARKMPFGATALDFAYDIHSKIGNSAISAKINHKLEPITTQINSGDQIEIITADTARPKPEWLDIVTTAKAKSAIKSFLKRERQNNIERGMQMLEERMKSLNIQLSGRVLRKIIPIYESNNKGGAVQQDRRRDRLAGRPGEGAQGQFEEQDPQVLDPVHSPEKGGGGRRIGRDHRRNDPERGRR